MVGRGATKQTDVPAVPVAAGARIVLDSGGWQENPAGLGGWQANPTGLGYFGRVCLMPYKSSICVSLVTI